MYSDMLFDKIFISYFMTINKRNQETTKEVEQFELLEKSWSGLNFPLKCWKHSAKEPNAPPANWVLLQDSPMHLLHNLEQVLFIVSTSSFGFSQVVMHSSTVLLQEFAFGSIPKWNFLNPNMFGWFWITLDWAENVFNLLEICISR